MSGGDTPALAVWAGHPRGPLPPSNWGQGFAERLLAAVDRADAIYERARQRRRLAELDLRMLADCGIPLDAADAEAARPWWRA